MPDSNVKACGIQVELYNLGLKADGYDVDTTKKLAQLSEEARQLAESDLAPAFDLQTEFFRKVIDDSTPSGWVPSDEMNKARERIWGKCGSLGFDLG
jgi:hypothetical protein